MQALSGAPDESPDNSSLVKSEDGNTQHDGGRSSPPPNCAICLGRCRNKSFTDSCLHQFCFKCLVTWSRVKTECPLCKQNFKSIIHNVKSNHQYEEYPVQQPQNEAAGSMSINEFVNAARRFRYRTTLTIPRSDTMAIQQFLMHYPLSALVNELPAPSARHSGRPRRSPADFRRTVYRHNLWARPLPDFTGRFRECTPEFFQYNGSQIHRLVPWLNRELYYLLNENTGHIAYVLDRILDLLREHRITSREFRTAMLCYFGERTDHFLHEFHCFASTPYDLAGYDRYVQYQTDARVSAVVNEVLSSSDSDSRDSDIVMVSSSHPATAPAPGTSRAPPATSRAQPGTSHAPPATSRAQSGISHAPPAEPQTTLPSHYNSQSAVIPIETISHSDSDSNSSEVMVVGYIKPPHQRTPELVDLLGSDSDVVVQDTEGEAVRLTLSRPRRVSTEANVDSDSDSYGPRLRRSRRARTSPPAPPPPVSPLPASPPPPAALPAAPTPPFSSEDEDSYEDTTEDSSSSYGDRKKRTKRKTKRKSTRAASSRSSGKSKRRSPRQRKDKKKSDPEKKSDERQPDKDKRRKDKSRNGKNVKSSKMNLMEIPLPPEPAPAPTVDQPGPSGLSNCRKRKSSSETAPRRGSRESKRLKSVVKVMKSIADSGEGTGSSKSEVAEPAVNGTKDRTKRKTPGATRSKNFTRFHSYHDDSTDLSPTSSSDDNIPLRRALRSNGNDDSN